MRKELSSVNCDDFTGFMQYKIILIFLRLDNHLKLIFARVDDFHITL